MLSRVNEGEVRDERWLIDACTMELRAHRAILLLLLCPLLGFWLPALMAKVGLSVALVAQASAAHRDDAAPSWMSAVSVACFVLPVAALAVGAGREWRRIRAADARAGEGMRLPERQGAQLVGRVGEIWADLMASGESPTVICQSNFRILAHAYDDASGRKIEVSAGLATRVVRGDELATSILRHEVAHLVFRDLPAIRLQSVAVAAATYSIRLSLIACALAAATVVVLTDIGTFPIPPSLGNVIAVHLAIVLATANVTLPLLLGRYVVRRYSGFVVALAEIRADVSAGVWGDGLAAFSKRIDADPTVRAPETGDVGLAYLSPSLSHFPPNERKYLLASPERLSTPKLRYFAIALATIWFLAFHQGQMVWDRLLLCSTVALVQGLTFSMVLATGDRGGIGLLRSLSLACGVVLAQALPLVSIEGLVYLTQHLTAAIVVRGGFGSADDVDYLRDVFDTLREFGGSASAAVGGLAGPLALVFATVSFWLMPRAFSLARPGSKRKLGGIALAVAATSFLVSYGFFQAEVAASMKRFAFAVSPQIESDDDASERLSTVVAFRMALGQYALGLGEALDGPPALSDQGWLRVALPSAVGSMVVLLAAMVSLRAGRRGRLDLEGGRVDAG